jgi:calcium/proton exchanger cax
VSATWQLENKLTLRSIIALVKNEIRIVQASLIGSLLANLLLILGMAFLIGGLEYQEQIYDSTVTQMSACLLALAVLSLLIPVRSNVQSAPPYFVANECPFRLPSTHRSAI